MFFPILDIINLTLTSCAFCTNFCIKKSNQLNWGSLNAMMKMNELYLFFFKNWLKSDWNIFIIKKSWCLLICNLQPLNHPKTQIPSSINPTFYFSLLWNALYVLNVNKWKCAILLYYLSMTVPFLSMMMTYIILY